MPAMTAAKTALLVVGSTSTLSTSDAALKARLDRYYSTTLRDDGAAALTTTTLVVIAASASPAAVGTKYKNLAKGVLVLAPGLFPAMGMTTAGSFGSIAGQTKIKLVNANEQLSAGFVLNRLARSTAQLVDKV
jgi:hypothetical protein